MIVVRLISGLANTAFYFKVMDMASYAEQLEGKYTFYQARLEGYEELYFTPKGTDSQAIDQLGLNYDAVEALTGAQALHFIIPCFFYGNIEESIFTLNLPKEEVQTVLAKLYQACLQAYQANIEEYAQALDFQLSEQAYLALQASYETSLKVVYVKKAKQRYYQIYQDDEKLSTFLAEESESRVLDFSQMIEVLVTYLMELTATPLYFSDEAGQAIYTKFVNDLLTQFLSLPERYAYQYLTEERGLLSFAWEHYGAELTKLCDSLQAYVIMVHQPESNTIVESVFLQDARHNVLDFFQEVSHLTLVPGSFVRQYPSPKPLLGFLLHLVYQELYEADGRGSIQKHLGISQSKFDSGSQLMQLLQEAVQGYVGHN
ncbi:hypothetical protein CL176_04895 [Suicoccus acidiformans]|uniref:Uncharacterized protein n=1 Tax=Suicoccus acidiformans TaxID=2036206 RepID=A0A347WJY4_9LACT|nr:hypothetical protein CL176_04895 [Suicoccus acidiformans]